MKVFLGCRVLACAALLGGWTVSLHALVNVDFVSVQNAGNAASTSGAGSVNYDFGISKYEITNAQYAEFLNAAAKSDPNSLYDANMGSSVFGGISRSGTAGNFSYAAKTGYENKPVMFVSFFSAVRFVNWLNNGQGTSDTEQGAYTCNMASGLPGYPDYTASVSARSAGATFALPTLDEWYKAAYYDPTKDGGLGGYWKQATRSDTLGDNTDYGASNGANYNDGDFANGGLSGPGTTDVGSYFNASGYYGTFDQSGNVWEWTEGIAATAQRYALGGSWAVYATADDQVPASESSASANIGFRIVTLAIPEPANFATLAGLLCLGMTWSRRPRKSRPTS